MTTKELIHAEIERLSEEDLEKLYHFIRSFTPSTPKEDGRSLMSKLRSIQIQGPADFAANLDLYLSGEKSFEPDIH